MVNCERCTKIFASAIPVETLIDRFPSSGEITVSAQICDVACSNQNSFISILYGDHINHNNSFVFNSSVSNLPTSEPVSGGGIGLILTAEGQASGVNFFDNALLSNIHFLHGTIIGNAICSISLKANGRTFEVPGCIFCNNQN